MSKVPKDPVQNYNGVPGLVVDPWGGAVDTTVEGVLSVPDCLALSAKTLLEMREALLEIPNLGDWCMYGAADLTLLQFFPNSARLRNPEVRAAAAEVVMGWLKGEWRTHHHTSRAAKVKIGDRDCIVILHGVDGAVVAEPGKGDATHA